MPFELLVGLQVEDDAVYAAYRAGIAPFLEKHGGGFRYDFAVARVLKQPTDAPINRVFTLRFRDRAARDAFFADPGYQKVKEEFFARSVTSTTIIAEYPAAHP